MKHQPDCRWQQTTAEQCDYRETHHYCPHPEHACNCSSIEVSGPIEPLKELARFLDKWQETLVCNRLQECLKDLKSVDFSPGAYAEKLEAEIAALKEKWETFREDADKVYADNKALKEPMACGHPKACWVDAVVATANGIDCESLQGTCTACEHERLAVAAALVWADKHFKQFWLALCELEPTVKYLTPSADKLATELRGGISDSDRSALDAHDAEVRDRALEDAAEECEGSQREHELSWNRCVCKMSDQIRALRGSK